jgi:pimeloyl-ACP methyl ester carboxylesterase
MPALKTTASSVKINPGITIPIRIRSMITILLATLVLLLPQLILADEAVILLHGMGNVPLSMKYLENRLEKAGYRVHNLGYPSTDIPIEEAAERIRDKIYGLERAETIHFVAHSIGNLVVRRMFDRELPNLGRMVMIAPPNRGSLAAQQLHDLDIYQWIFGPSGQQLSADRTEFFESLPEPPCEFGIIAGGRGTENGYNPLLPGDDDGTVRVEETKLPGAADFILLKDTHTLILFDRETAEQTVHFLKTGRFRK